MLVISVSLNMVGLMFNLYGYIRSTVRLRENESRERVLSFWNMIGWSIYSVADILSHNAFAYIAVAFAAWFTYRWWNSGGGPGLKNKITKLVQKIIPTVVPAGSAA